MKDALINFDIVRTCDYVIVENEVMKIIKLKIKPNEINKGYLNTKKTKSNHIF